MWIKRLFCSHEYFLSVVGYSTKEAVLLPTDAGSYTNRSTTMLDLICPLCQKNKRVKFRRVRLNAAEITHILDCNDWKRPL